MQNGKKPNHSKIHCQVEAAALFVLFYGGNLCKIATDICFPHNSDHTPKKSLPGLDSFLMSGQDFLLPGIFFRQ